MLIRKFTRNGRDEALAAAIVRALEPRFDAIDRRFDAFDDRFDALEQRLEAMDAKWERRFIALRNELVAAGEPFIGLQDYLATRFERTVKLMDSINKRIDRMTEEITEQIAEQFAALSATVSHGLSERGSH